MRRFYLGKHIFQHWSCSNKWEKASTLTSYFHLHAFSIFGKDRISAENWVSDVNCVIYYLEIDLNKVLSSGLKITVSNFLRCAVLFPLFVIFGQMLSCSQLLFYLYSFNSKLNIERTFFVSSKTKKANKHIEELPSSDWHVCISLWIALIASQWKRVEPSVGCTISWSDGLGLYKKTKHDSKKDKRNNIPLRFLLQVPAITYLQTEIIHFLL